LRRSALLQTAARAALRFNMLRLDCDMTVRNNTCDEEGRRNGA